MSTATQISTLTRDTVENPLAKKRQRILFVDDEPNFLEGLRRMLRAFRDAWDMQYVNSVDEAVELTRKINFDIIVSDVSMPIKTGLDLLEEMRDMEHTQNIPIVILTGNAEGNLKRRALDLGATDLLNKPVVQEDLIARIRSALRIKKYEDDIRDQNITLERKVRERTKDLDEAQRDIIWRLAKAGEYRDEETGDHVIRVALCSKALAETMGMDDRFIETLFLTSPLHDVGKIGIPDSILLKEGPLTPEERKEMESHCEIGANILLAQPKGISAFVGSTSIDLPEVGPHGGGALRAMAAEVALSHHEKWDGSGYPYGRKGDEIPLSGLIVSVADVYDALRSERPYKKSFDVDKTMSIMKEGAGSHFAPHVFQAFEGIVAQFEDVRRHYEE